MSPRLAFAVDAAYRAGRLTLAYFQSNTPVDWKDDRTPVTRADREAEALLRKEISNAFSGEAILGEEEGMQGEGNDRWVIDPVDGTKSFIAGVPLYATLLSFERNGEPEIAVCYFPALDEMLCAEKGKGTLWNGRAARVSGLGLDHARLTCGSIQTFAASGKLDSLLTLAKPVSSLRTWCDAYGHALVATGRAEAMIDPQVHRWDISAMSLLVREAGGRFTDFRGREALGEQALASNGFVHEQVLEALA